MHSTNPLPAQIFQLKSGRVMVSDDNSNYSPDDDEYEVIKKIEELYEEVR